MKRIIIHWTAGNLNPSAYEKRCYHYLIGSNGRPVCGLYRPEDNEDCNDGFYAAHTGGGNTGSIGVAMCGMYVPNKTPVQKTQYPLTKIQCEACFKLCAELCKKYNIPVSADTVLTHYEFGKAHPNTKSAGKIDIIYLPPYPDVKANEVGNFIRNKVTWYLQRI